MSDKICIICGISQPLDNFYKCKFTKDGVLPRCKLCQKLYTGQYQKNNKEKVKKYQSKWQQNNKEAVYAINKKWAENNPEKRRELKRKWDRKAMLNPLHRLSNNIRGNMHHALKTKKAGRTWESLVGYSLQDLVNHIEPLLNETMTWDNYGSIWHIDHITPKSWFKYESTDDPKFKECWALSNLQPKLKIDNIKKGNRFAG